MFPLGGDRFGVKTRSYITELTLMQLQAAMRHKYEEFIKEGSLHVMPGNVLDMMEVYDDLEKFIEASQYDVRSLGYDPYNANVWKGAGRGVLSAKRAVRYCVTSATVSNSSDKSEHC